MKFLIIGCGSIGRRHAANLLSLGHGVVGYNRGKDRRESIARDLGISVYADLDHMLDKEKADAAAICTPQHMHVEHSLAAIERGLHLFVEKPVSHSMAGLDELEAAARQRSLITHVGCNMRFHFGPATVKRYLDEGLLGRPLWSYFWGGMHLPDWHPDEDYRQMYSAKIAQGGGVVMDFVHELDLVQWFHGRPVDVAAITGHSGWLDIETEDMADAVMRFESGVQSILHIDYLQRPFQRGIRVVGDAGWAEWNLDRQGVEFFCHKTREKKWIPYPQGYGHNDMYMDQMRYFITCILDQSPSLGPLDAGRQALDLAIRIRKSSSNNRFS